MIPVRGRVCNCITKSERCESYRLANTSHLCGYFRTRIMSLLLICLCDSIPDHPDGTAVSGGFIDREGHTLLHCLWALLPPLLQSLYIKCVDLQGCSLSLYGNTFLWLPPAYFLHHIFSYLELKRRINLIFYQNVFYHISSWHLHSRSQRDLCSAHL